MKKLFLIFSCLLLCAISFAQIRGTTLVPFPDQDNEAGWNAYNSDRLGSQRDLHRIGKFTGLRYICSDDLQGTPGLHEEARAVLSLAGSAAAEGYQQVVFAIMGDYSACEASSPYYRSMADVCLQFFAWETELVKLQKKYPRTEFLLSFNDLDLQDTVTDVLAKGQNPTSAKRKPVPPSAAVERNIMATTWALNPNQKWIRQARSVPLGFSDPRVMLGGNAYVPAAMWDAVQVPALFRLTWPMEDKDRDALMATAGYTMPDYQRIPFNGSGLRQYVTSQGMDTICEFGLPDTFPYPMHLRYWRDMFSLGVNAYGFRFPFWLTKGVDKTRLAQLASTGATAKPLFYALQKLVK